MKGEEVPRAGGRRRAGWRRGEGRGGGEKERRVGGEGSRKREGEEEEEERAGTQGIQGERIERQKD